MVLAIVMLLGGCTKKEILLAPKNSTQFYVRNMVFFSNRGQFENFMQKANDDNSIIRNAAPSNFTSFEDKKNSILSILENKPDDSISDSLRYDLSLKSRLVPDEMLRRIFNENLEIQLGDTIYKVSEFGTFVIHRDNIVSFDSFWHLVKSGKEFRYDRILNRFEGEVLEESTGLIVNPKGFKRFDTYNGFKDITSSLEEWDVKNTPTVQKKLARTVSADVVAGFITHEKGFNKYYDKERVYFPNDRRLTFEIYNYNYFFYASVGMKAWFECKYQTRYWLLGWRTGVTYWGDENADKIGIGWEMIDLRHDVQDQGSYMSLVRDLNAMQYPQFKGIMQVQLGNYKYPAATFLAGSLALGNFFRDRGLSNYFAQHIDRGVVLGISKLYEYGNATFSEQFSNTMDDIVARCAPDYYNQVSTLRKSLNVASTLSKPSQILGFNEETKYNKDEIGIRLDWNAGVRVVVGGGGDISISGTSYSYAVNSAICFAYAQKYGVTYGIRFVKR